MLQRVIRVWAMVCAVFWFSVTIVAAQKPQTAQQAAAAVVAEPEAPRVVLQAEQTAPVLRLMKFSGALRDPAGNARTGAVGLTFALYKEQQVGSPLWLEVHNAQLDEQGRYTVLLGSTKSEGLPLELFSTGEARWLGVQLNLPGEEEQARVLLVSVPYALKAADAEMLGGKPPSAFLLAEKAEGREAAESKPVANKEAVKEGPRREQVVGTITGEGTINIVSKFTGANTIGDGSLFDNGFVGVGNTNPFGKLTVTHPLSGSVTKALLLESHYDLNSGAKIVFDSLSNNGERASIGYSIVSGGGGDVFFNTSPQGGFPASERLRITNTGSVGIGSSNPFGKLTVTNPVAGSVSKGLLLESHYDLNSGAKIVFDSLSNNGERASIGYSIVSGGGGELFFNTSPQGGFPVSERMRITSSGSIIANGLRVETTAGTPNVIGGFSGNTVSGGVVGATISGGGASGFANSVTANLGTVGGGRANTASGFATVGGGIGNIASGVGATVGGGSANTASGFVATVGGGSSNTASLNSATVGGGFGNTASGIAATVAGGDTNSASGVGATVPGGEFNTAAGQHSFAAGFRAKANHQGAFVWGDSTNADIASTANDQFLVRASGGTSFLAGNGGLRVLAGAGVPNLIGGHSANSVSGPVFGATIAGGGSSGSPNSVTHNGATVGGGFGNTASGGGATVGGGQNNTASGGGSTVPGGDSNTAAGSSSFAAGRRAKANHSGAFVWGDSSNFNVDSTEVNEFTARATGGVRFISAIDNSTGAGTAGVWLPSGASGWGVLSDRNSKENFAPVDGPDLLARLARIPVLTWNWRAQPASIRHMGPMAQDFRAAFGLGEDDKHISTVDADGVALAAIQALYQLSRENDRRIEELTREVRELRSLVQGTTVRRQ